MSRIAPCFLHLLVSALLALILSLGVAEAGIFQTPAGGSGFDRPAPPDRGCPRGC